MANRNELEHDDYAETAVLPAHFRPDCIEALDDAAAEAHGRYQEYVRSLDDVPVLVDVVSEPSRNASKDFRLGQRPDARRVARDDAAVLREQHASDTAHRYAEYVAIVAPLATSEPAPPRAAVSRARKRHAQKKRAKRVKRSARFEA